MVLAFVVWPLLPSCQPLLFLSYVCFGSLSHRCNDLKGKGAMEEFRFMGASVVDFNGDGYPDVVHTVSYGRMSFLENRLKQQQPSTRFLALTLHVSHGFA